VINIKYLIVDKKFPVLIPPVVWITGELLSLSPSPLGRPALGL